MERKNILYDNKLKNYSELKVKLHLLIIKNKKLIKNFGRF